MAYIRETKTAISKIKDPMSRLMVIGIITLCGAIVAMFFIIRNDRGQKLAEDVIKISQLEKKLDKKSDECDSQKIVIQSLTVDTAMIRAKFTIELYIQNEKFGKIIDSIKVKLMTK